MSSSRLSALIKILLGGTPVRCSNRQLWIQAVQDYFDDVPLCVPCRKLLQPVCETAPRVGCDVYLVNPDGSYQSGDLVALCRLAPFPSCGVKIQQPVNYQYLHKYGQRYWRQPENAQNPKTQGNLDKRGSDSFHNQQGRYECAVVTYCYVGSSAHLLVLEK